MKMKKVRVLTRFIITKYNIESKTSAAVRNIKSAEDHDSSHSC